MRPFRDDVYCVYPMFVVAFLYSLAFYSSYSIYCTSIQFNTMQSTPLNKAVRCGDLEIVKYLVDHNSTVNACDYSEVS